MKIQKVKGAIAPIVALSLAVTAPHTAYADDTGGALTGVTKLACEAILCLSASAGARPAECKPSIKHYFGIVRHKPHQTINARRDFLKLCPTGNSNMDETIENVLNNNYYNCSADALNESLRLGEYQKKIKHVRDIVDHTKVIPRFRRNCGSDWLKNKIERKCETVEKEEQYCTHYVGYRSDGKCNRWGTRVVTQEQCYYVDKP